MVPATEDSGPAPAPLEAATLIVYLEPLVNPRIQQLVAVEGVEQLNTLAPKVAVAMYPVMSEPPVEFGAAQETNTWVSSATAVSDVGAPGFVNGIPVIPVLAAPVPAAFTATTVTV